MSALILAALMLLAVPARCSLVVLTPNILRFNADETLVLSSSEAGTVSVVIKDWPNEAKTLDSDTNIAITPDKLKNVKIRINRGDYPNHDRLKLGDSPFVWVIAKIGDTESRTRVLMSYRGQNVFLQTDKPIYTPDQRVSITAYTTDTNNIPIRMENLRIDVMSPDGITVDRKEGNSHYDESGVSQNGLVLFKFNIGKNPALGEWMIIASQGFSIGDDKMEYIESGKASFEVRKYDLPTFRCTISDVPNYILADTQKVSGKVTARYTHDNSADKIHRYMKGEVVLHFGIPVGDNVLYTYTATATLFEGSCQFEEYMSAITRKINGFDFDRRAKGNRLYIKADCMEYASGEVASDVNTNAMFVASKYRLNFDRTRKYFKAGLSLVHELKLEYSNGKPASDIRVKVIAKVKLAEVGWVDLGLANNGNSETTTDAHGRGRVRFNVQQNAEEIKINYNAMDTEDLEEQWTMEHTDSDIIITTNKISYKVTDNIHVDMYNSKAEYSAVFVMALVRGDPVFTEKISQNFGTHMTNTIPINSKFIPSAQIIICSVDANKLACDSTWIDVEELCTSKIKGKTDKREYTLKKGQQATLTYESASSEASLVVQMIDHAVLALNDHTVLTADSMVQQLTTRSLHCGPAGDSTQKTLRMAGLAIATDLLQSQGYPFLISDRTIEECPAGGSRKRRSLGDDISGNNTHCCQIGRDKARSGDDCGAALIDFVLNVNPDITCIRMFEHCCKNNTLHVVESSLSSAERSFTKDERDEINVEVQNKGVRKSFPESVIFGVLKATVEGYVSHTFELPHSMTTWAVETVVMASDHSLCVLPPLDFTVSRIQFMKVRVPYRAIRGEHLLLKATFYNFAESDIPITVDLHMKAAKGLCYNARQGSYTVRKRREVEKNGAVTVSWVIVPLQIGTFDVDFLARSNKHVVDAVTKKLIVEPEGKAEYRHKSYKIDMQTNEMQDFCTQEGEKRRCTVGFPRDNSMVDGSVKGRVRVTGNSYGPAIDIVLGGVAKELRMPAGCGEQVMIRVGPSVYAYMYMEETDTLSPKIEMTTFPKLVKDGVNSMLRYRKKNGGFGVWTSTPASTWLTSFVLKVFAKAHSYVDLDKGFLQSAVQFLFSNQDAQGRFNEFSQVARHHGEMIGAVKDTDFTLTAFVTIALGESLSTLEVDQQKYDKSVSYLGRSVRHVRGSYEAALVAYALAGSTYKDAAMDKLKSYATDVTLDGLHVRYFRANSKKIQVETAAYAILAALSNDDVDYCYEIVVWLHTQKTLMDIFQTTQDTVVALQALSAYAAKTQVINTQLTGTISNEKDQTEQEQFSIDQSTGDQSFILNMKNTASGVFAVVEIQGIGQASVDVIMEYNTEEERECNFQLKIDQQVSATEQNNNENNNHMADQQEDDEQLIKLNMEICAKHLTGKPTEMAVVEVGLLTGFAPEKAQLEDMKLKKTIQEYELTEKTVVFYIESISHENPTCLKFNLVQEVGHSNLAPALIKVYDYYDPESSCSKLYSHESDWRLQYEGDKCYSGLCSRCYGVGNVRAFSYQDFKDRVCSPSVNYVLKVKDVRPEETGGWLYNVATIDKVLHTGGLPFKTNDKVYLKMRKACDCPDMQAGKQYLVLGRQESEVTVDGENQYHLAIDTDAYVEQWKSRPNSTHRRLRALLRRPCQT